MPLTALIFWTIYVAGISSALIYPAFGVFLYILVYHVNPEQQWWGANIQSLGLRTSFTVAAATAIGMFIRRPPPEPGVRQFPTTYVLALVLSAFAILSMGWGFGPSEKGMFHAEKITKLMIFLFILLRCVRTPEHYHLALLAWLIGVAYIGYQASGNIGLYIGGRLSSGVGGPDFAESSDLSVHIVATLPLLAAMFFSSRTWIGRTFVLVAGALAIDTLVMTRTRNALVGLAAITVVMVCSLPRGYRMKGWIAIICGGLCAVQLTDPGWWERMATTLDYQNDPAAVGRLQFWNAAVEMAYDYPLGIGLGNFHANVRHYIDGVDKLRSVHSTFFACLAELGWIGCCLLLGVVLTAVKALTRVRREALGFDSTIPITVANRETRFHLVWHATALRAALIGYLACAMFTTRLWAEDFWILLGFAMCLRNVCVQMQNRALLGDTQAAPAPSVAVSSGPARATDRGTDEAGPRPEPALPAPPRRPLFTVVARRPVRALWYRVHPDAECDG